MLSSMSKIKTFERVDIFGGSADQYHRNGHPIG
jgi:hypothetical protein